MRRPRLGAPAAIALALLSTLASPALATPHRASIDGGVELVFDRRPAMDGSGRVLPALQAAPVTIHFVTKPTPADAAALKSLGVRLALGPSGAPRVYGRFLLADIPKASLEAVAALPRVERILLDGSPFGDMPTLDATAAEVQAIDAWGAQTDDGASLTGQGVTVCDVDTGIDVFHPSFFRADGGYYKWIDVNGNGQFDPAVDGVDLIGDGEPTVLRVLDAVIVDRDSGKPISGQDDPSYSIGTDYLYVDVNGNGSRDYGRDAGFQEGAPTYGERLFLADDVNRNGKLDPGEKLVALGTSKIKEVRVEDDIFKRGENLIDHPRDVDLVHATSVAGILLGGNRGLTKRVGVAPDAELIVAAAPAAGKKAALTDYCVQKGARVILHEYGGYIDYPLDGSHPTEQIIDETSVKTEGQGIAHITPVGNLASAEKAFKTTLVGGFGTTVTLRVPSAGYSSMTMSFLWRDSRDLKFKITEPGGATFTIPVDYTGKSGKWKPGLSVWFKRTDSDRTTSRVTFSFWSPDNTPNLITPGDWKVEVTDPLPLGSLPTPFLGYLRDNVSGWEKGIYFPDGATDEHTFCSPATADHGIGIGAYSIYPESAGDPGALAPYSSRGTRIDGAHQLSIAAPADPITSRYQEGYPNAYTMFMGTSGAGPHAAGAAALILQKDPQKSGDEVRDTLRAGALADANVGAVPNDEWGYGKLRIYQSLFGAAPPGGAAPEIAIAPVTVAPGEEATITIDASDPDEPASALAFDLDPDYDGVYETRLAGPSFTVKYDQEGVYRAKVRVTDSSGKESAALAVIEVKKSTTPDNPDEMPPDEMPPVETPPDDSESSEDPPAEHEAPSTESEGGCSLSGGASSPGAWLLGAAALAALAGRRRARR